LRINAAAQWLHGLDADLFFHRHGHHFHDEALEESRCPCSPMEFPCGFSRASFLPLVHFKLTFRKEYNRWTLVEDPSRGAFQGHG
jgi:hypothetical protein